LALLEDNGVTPEVFEYLKASLSTELLTSTVVKLGVNVRDIIRTKEAEYKETGLDNPSLTNAEIYAILVNTPKLIERPIVIRGNKAAIGRPPENVLAIL
jgi:arsenate reductase